MYVPGPLPLRLTLRSRDFAFNTTPLDVVAKLIAGTSVTCAREPKSLVLCSTLEAELHRAGSILRQTFTDMHSDAINVAYVEAGSALKEPYTRIIVQTPHDYYGDVLADLCRRFGAIDATTDVSVDVMAVTATAPSSELLGYSTILGNITRGRGNVVFEHLGYDFVWPRPGPPDPKNPAVAKRA